ncbi:phosphatase PAP2 family protein [Deinococcus aluminii]|uniref:Phosphatidic acid phosphatase type 2/haloperoxidase domain-containing protein n=1 Tax=Deinococcus aluminii TaxID=1656885 RepID=A0ABP9XFA7_9DEIO
MRASGLLALVVGLLAPLLLLGLLAWASLAPSRSALEAPLLLAVHAHATPTLDRWMLTVTTLGRFAFVALYVAVILAFLRPGRRRTAFLVVAVGGAALLGNLLKLVFHHPRPHLWAGLVTESGASFPSGHATGTAAFAVAVTLLAWRTRWRWPVLLLAVTFMLLVGFSRVYLGVHYPSDVLAGWLTGLAWVMGTWILAAGERRRAAP